MATYFVSRHPGAHEWAASQGLAVDKVVPHYDPLAHGSGDHVIGTLPINLVADLCARGGRYWHLVIDIPPNRRGHELSCAELLAYGARLVEYRAEEVSDAGMV